MQVVRARLRPFSSSLCQAQPHSLAQRWCLKCLQYPVPRSTVGRFRARPRGGCAHGTRPPLKGPVNQAFLGVGHVYNAGPSRLLADKRRFR